jgi:hypothetical protein
MKASSFLLHLAMEETTKTIFSSEFDDIQPVERRWTILPWWIRAFSWLFLLFGALSPFILIGGFFGLQTSLNLYGISSTDPLSIAGFSVVVLFMLKGVAAYGLWAEKNWGITVAEIDAILGIAICIFTFFTFTHTTHNFFAKFRLEIVILAIYLVKLYRLQDRWNAGVKK